MLIGLMSAEVEEKVDLVIDIEEDIPRNTIKS